MVMFASVVLGLVTVAGLLWAFCVMRQTPMDAAARTQAPGRCVPLSDGVTHYLLEGPEDGPVIMCVHGLTTPSYVWETLAAALVAQGHRVLRYDLYGRGFSDSPSGRYDTRRYVKQAVELLDTLDIQGPVTAMGYSMGGAIVTAFADQHPARVSRLVLLAPGGLGHDLGRFNAICAAVPGIGDWLYEMIGGWLMRRDIAGESPSAPGLSALADRLLQETRRRGYLRAVLSSTRHMLGQDQAAIHARIASTQCPVVAVWGAVDPIIPLAAKDRLAAINPAARHVVIPNADHALPTEHPDAVLRALAD